jgi:hypothetical protein
MAPPLAERVHTKESIALIIIVGASNRLAALSVNTNDPDFFIFVLQKNREWL